MTPEKSWHFVRHEEEKFFFDPKTQRKEKFASLNDRGTVALSVIVPAKNEEERLPVMLDECLAFLSKDYARTWEVIIVDDGSDDGTSRVALDYVKRWGADRVRLLKLRHNRGKGGAVRLGVLCARGRRLLMADADGATLFSDVLKLEKCLPTDDGAETALENENHVIVGSRAHLEKESISSRSWFRTILMWGFHLLVWLFCVRTVHDTQCGFKLFSRSAARVLFPALHIEKWAFDVELLYLGEALQMSISEVSVTWHEVDGSKIVPVWSWLQMGRDLLLIWLRYTLRIWKVPRKQD